MVLLELLNYVKPVGTSTVSNEPFAERRGFGKRRSVRALTDWSGAPVTSEAHQTVPIVRATSVLFS